ncbi:MAG: hypothetical protein R2867_20445 [Caldilineaceae bacterium]
MGEQVEMSAEHCDLIAAALQDAGLGERWSCVGKLGVGCRLPRFTTLWQTTATTSHASPRRMTNTINWCTKMR